MNGSVVYVCIFIFVILNLGITALIKSSDLDKVKSINRLLGFELIFGFFICLFTLYMSLSNQKQTDRIDDNVKYTKDLSEEVRKLQTVNKQISENIRFKVDSNNIFITETNKLATVIEEISKKSREVSIEINERTGNQFAEIALTGKLNFKNPYELRNTDSITFQYGSTTMVQTISELTDINGPHKNIVLGNKELVKVNYLTNHILINTTVYDLSGNWVLEIVNNYWRRNPNYTGKFNYDENGFEIIDNRGYVVLSLDMKGKDRINLQGYVLSREAGILFVFGKTAMTWLSLGDKTPMTEFNNTFRDAGVKQIFTYTGENWLHERVK